MANLTQNNDAPVVQIINDQITTTSTDIAKCFHKRHDNILRKIENLECSAEFNVLNFEAVEYKDGKGESRPMYRITKDGFVYLAMGFTGSKAAQFKEAYINAFNQMEKQLNEQKQLPAAQPDNPDEDKYKLLNNMILSMDFKTNPVVVPAIDIINMIQAIRLHQTQIAQLTLSLRQADWVNDNIDNLKKATQRNFVDF